MIIIALTLVLLLIVGGKIEAIRPRSNMKVVWNPDGHSKVDCTTFLNMTRSLGDYWSFNRRTEKYIISPNPDVSAIPLDLSTQKLVLIASDGLWTVMTPNEVVSFIHGYQHQNEAHVVSALIREALYRWDSFASRQHFCVDCIS